MLMAMVGVLPPEDPVCVRARACNGNQLAQSLGLDLARGNGVGVGPDRRTVPGWADHSENG